MSRCLRWSSAHFISTFRRQDRTAAPSWRLAFLHAAHRGCLRHTAHLGSRRCPGEVGDDLRAVLISRFTRWIPRS